MLHCIGMERRSVNPPRSGSEQSVSNKQGFAEVLAEKQAENTRSQPTANRVRQEAGRLGVTSLASTPSERFTRRRQSRTGNGYSAS